ncbi:class I SAM-dependent methyltransferase [uncultured Cytophaga sp.]|uniref:class I SAM-dependent methyltransferase n=1 Tax=uncultured Cytophaga sp. TaxID=160238 RepID=UPI0026282BE2|nr:class I SAM-dependent methyltransferase [uncultured Cytophaga sp.]
MAELQKEWFDTWFDTPYYHILYSNRDNSEAEVFLTNLMNHLSVPQGASILDLPCGKGRHTLFLAEKGFTLTGADLSNESISLAKSYAPEGVTFLVHDLRKPAWNETFDYVLNLFTSFGYFETEAEDRAAFTTLSKALKTGGKLVIDFMNVTHALNMLKEEETKVIQGIEFRLKRYLKDGYIHKEIRFEADDTPYFFTERVKALSLEDFKEFFTFAGLTLVDTFGSYQLEAYDAKESDRLIMIAKK